MTPFGHDFRDPALYELALTHSSVEGTQDNERLEFLGDAALDLVVAEELYATHPDLSEGPLTELKAAVVSRKALAEAARRLALEDAARVGRGLGRRALSRAVLANLFEALLGAIYLDGGFAAARRFVLSSLADDLARVREDSLGGVPKQRLQELCQRRWGEPPIYVVLEQRGKSHARAFLVAAEADGEQFPSAWGRTVKEAESRAAEEALLVLEEDEAR
jgi:ribonuclease-3